MRGQRDRLARAGAVITVLSLILPLLWVPALAIALILLFTSRIRAGVLVLIFGVAVLPAVGAILYTTFVLATYRSPSPSMQPELRVGERFVVLKVGREPRVGDVVVFHPPSAAEQADDQCASEPAQGEMCAQARPGRASVQFVKRVVAVGGDRIAMRRGRIVRNGRPEPRRPLGDCENADGCEYREEITVPDGQLYLLGDNRGASDDSRFWGPVPEAAVVGRYWFSYAGR